LSPFSKDTMKVAWVLVLLFIIFNAIAFPFHPILNILLTSILLVSIYLVILYRFKLSEDITVLIHKLLKKKK